MMDLRITGSLIILIVGISYDSCYGLRRNLLDISPINWTPEVSQKTLRDSFIVWDHFYRKTFKPEVDGRAFLRALQKGTYKLLSSNEFSKLDFIYDRLKLYPHALTPEETYPPHDRPLGLWDVFSVNYHLTTQNPVSPICVAQVTLRSGEIKFALLDGMHRRIAAAFRKSAIKILLIDL